MRAVVDPDLCVGCGLCEDLCPEVFELEDEIAIVIANPVPVEVEQTCQEATSGCPVEAISIET